MQLVNDIGDALILAKVEIQGMQCIGSGHMDHTQPVSDVVVLTSHRHIPSVMRGFRSMDGTCRWWRNEAGANVRLVVSLVEFERWQLAARVVRKLFLMGVTLDREARITVYREITRV